MRFGFRADKNPRDWSVSIAAQDCLRLFSEELKDYSFFGRLSTFCAIEPEMDVNLTKGDEYAELVEDVVKRGLDPNVRSSIVAALHRDSWLSKCKPTSSLHFASLASLTKPRW